MNVSLIIDLYHRMDVFHHFSLSWFSNYRIIRLYICLFNGFVQLLLHDIKVCSNEILEYNFWNISVFVFVFSRMCYRWSMLVKSIFVLTCVFFFMNHFSYLIVGRFDYSYNMKANVITGIYDSEFYSINFIVTLIQLNIFSYNL